MPFAYNPLPTELQAQAILKAAPLTLAAAPPSETKMKAGWLPPRNVWAGGLAGIIAWLILHAVSIYAHIDVVTVGQTLGFDPFTVLSGLIGGAIAWAVPPSVADVVTNLNDAIVHIAQKDPQSNVSYVIAPVQPPPGEPAVIVPPAVKLKDAA